MKQLMIAGKEVLQKFMGKRWLLCYLLFFIGCNPTLPYYNKLEITTADSVETARVNDRAFVQIDSVKHIIFTGDLITRTGNDFTSESLRQLNQRDKTYSHCGIASIEEDTLFVYHALGGEFNPDQKIRRDPIEVFGEPFSNRGIGIFRFSMGAHEKRKVMFAIRNWYTRGIMFDIKFDLATNDRMYCSEFIYKAFQAGSAHMFPFNTSKIKDFYFVGVDDLFMHPACKEIKRIRYK